MNHQVKELFNLDTINLTVDNLKFAEMIRKHLKEEWLKL